MANSVIDDMNDPEFRKLLAQEELILEVTETICELLENEKISRKELADRLGKSKGFISQLLNGGRNLTLRRWLISCTSWDIKLPSKAHKEEKQRREYQNHRISRQTISKDKRTQNI